jgi:hypothetical protein
MTMIPSYLSRVALISLLLGCGALGPAQDPGARADAGPFAASVTVHIGANEDMNADGVASVLQNQRFLNSIGAKLSVGGVDAAREQPDLAFVSLEPIGPEIVAISVHSMRRDLVKPGLTSILDAIPKLEPELISNAKRELADADANFTKATEALQAARAAQEKWVSQNGPVEPSAYLERAKEQLVQHSQELAQVQFDLATQLSLRDFLKERVAAEPADIETRRTIPNPRRLMLERQIDAVMNTNPPSADIAKFTESQLKMIETIEKQIAAGGYADKEIVEKTPNPRRGELETQLFETERAIADLKSREGALAKSCETLRADTIRLWRAAGEWDAIQETWNRAFETHEHARARVEQSQQIARDTLANPWFRILAGPRFD